MSEDRPTDVPERDFPVVGIGASAGGLQAFQAFFEAVPDRPGMAFVVVQHLSPDHESELADLLQSKTDLAVAQIEDASPIEPDHVYVIPPGKNLEVEDGRLRLTAPTRERGHRSPIDLFFRSLAEGFGERAVCIVLSGTGSDGTLGLKAIKERGGLTMAQAADDAEYDGMPRSALGTGFVDLSGTAAELAAKLVEVRRAADLVDLPEDETQLPLSDADALRELLALLRERTGHDFHDYKRSTILRRIGRRMQMNHVENLADYLDLARGDDAEVQALFRDFLISVTNFFRDPEAFERLEADVVPALFEDKKPGEQVRVWVPGCATGEEAYSIAMLLHEHAATLGRAPDLQVFATDIDEEALTFAREGFYPSAAAADLSPERLTRFFDEEATGYRVRQGLRETVLFATHNLIDDPPFSRLDLVSCRNLLIYLQREVQARVFGVFHYDLRPGGYLFLGSSEAPAALTKTFREVGKRERIFQRRDAVTPQTAFPIRSGAPVAARQTNPRGDADGVDDRTLVERYDDWTLRRYAPPRLLVDEDADITHVFGNAGRYLRDREGPASQNVIEKVLRALRLDLRTALYQAFQRNKATETPFQRVEVEGEECIVRMRVGPVDEDGFPSRLAEIVFVELDPRTVTLLGASMPEGSPDGDDPGVQHLEEELRATRERLQATIEEQETSNEELKASNEELQSLNEELQSTTEELETSKEELQSMNEELRTVNQELKNKIEELNRANADLQNLMASTDIGTLFLDHNLRLQRFTPRATDLFNIIPSDLGRPFAHISHQIDHGTLPDLAREVLDTLQPVEEELRDHDGRWYLMGMRPYRTEQNVIDGVVATFVDIDLLKRAQQRAAGRADQQRAVAELGRLALDGGILDDLLRQAVETVAASTGAAFAKVLELDPDGATLLLREGIGWKGGRAGRARVPNDGGSQAGYTLRISGPVHVDDVETEARFSAPALLTEHDVRSGISVTIPGPEGAPFGVLGVHDPHPGTFEPDDLRFVENVANVLGAALRRDHDAAVIAAQLAEIEAVYDAAPVGLAYLDADLCYVRINERLADFNGRAVDDHLGKPIYEVLPSIADVLRPLLEHVLDAGEPAVDIEIRGTTPAHPDEEQVFLASYVPQRVGGETVGINLVVRDVTPLAQARERLLASERQLRLALEGARLGTWSRNLRTDQLTFDERARELFGMEPVTAFADAMARVHADDRAEVEAAIARALDPDDEADDYGLDHRIVLPDGTVRWLSARGRAYFDQNEGFDQNGSGQARRPTSLAGVVFDITARKRAEAQARERLTEIEAIYASAPVGLCVLDRDFRYVRINERLARINGRSVADHLGRTVADLFADAPDASRPHVEAVFETGEARENVTFSMPAPSQPGVPRDWLVSFYPLAGDDGAVEYVSIVVQEITALKETQRELERLTAELEERVAARTAQVRTLANDLTQAEQRERQRIAQVLHDDLQQVLYALKMKAGQVEAAVEARLGVAADARLATLFDQCNDLFDRAIQTARTLTVDLSPPVLAGEGLDRSLQWLVPRMEEAYGLTTVLNVEGDTQVDPSIHALLFQFVRELLFNVVKHAGVNEADLDVRREDDRLRIAVTDHGRGFDRTVLEKPDGQSGGFGLFSIRERLRLVGGSLDIVSHPNDGTSVIIEAPSRV